MRIKNAQIKFTLFTLLVTVFNFQSNSVSHADTQVSGQIITSSTTWSAQNGPYVVSGEIQIPKGVTLNIGAGAQVDFSHASVTLVGQLNIGSSSGPQVTLKVGQLLLDKGTGGVLNIDNTVMSGPEFGSQGINALWGAAPESVSILNSNLSNFSSIVGGQIQSVSIKNSLINNSFSVSDNASTFYNFELSGNAFYNLQNFAEPSQGVFVNMGQASPKYSYTNNVFFNDTKNLVFNLPSTSHNSTFSGNYFASVEKLSLIAQYGAIAGGNYWGVPDEASLRLKAKVSDYQTDITLPKINFSPLLTSAPNSTQSAATRINDAVQVQAAAKAAADAAAKAAADAAASRNVQMCQARRTALLNVSPSSLSQGLKSWIADETLRLNQLASLNPLLRPLVDNYLASAPQLPQVGLEPSDCTPFEDRNVQAENDLAKEWTPEASIVQLWMHGGSIIRSNPAQALKQFLQGKNVVCVNSKKTIKTLKIGAKCPSGFKSP